MSMITLQKPSQSEVTLLSNIFIDDYMPEANGEFVKVYIYLLRALSTTPVSFTLEQMADHLLCTRKGYSAGAEILVQTGASCPGLRCR